jgi:hypothetical protein
MYICQYCHINTICKKCKTPTSVVKCEVCNVYALCYDCNLSTNIHIVRNTNVDLTTCTLCKAIITTDYGHCPYCNNKLKP